MTKSTQQYVSHLCVRSLKFHAWLPAEVSKRITSITLLILQPGLLHNKMHFFFQTGGERESENRIKAPERERGRDKPKKETGSNQMCWK